MDPEDYIDDYGALVGSPPLSLVRMGLRIDAQIKEAIGWSADQWLERAHADERVAECYSRRGVSADRLFREIESIAALVWGITIRFDEPESE